MKALQVTGWHDHYETHDSRRRKGPLSWVAISTKHDGVRFQRTAQLPNCADVFAGWVQIVQIAAKCPKRGLLVNDRGEALTVEDMALATRYPIRIFEAAINALTEFRIGWLEWVELEESCRENQKDAASGAQSAATSAPHAADVQQEARLHNSTVQNTTVQNTTNTSLPQNAEGEPKRERKPREPDPLWDAVAAQWFDNNPVGPNVKRCGKIVRDLKAMNATPDELATRIKRYRAEWPDAECTPEAMVKHWQRFAKASKPKDDEDGLPGFVPSKLTPEDFGVMPGHPDYEAGLKHLAN